MDFKQFLTRLDEGKKKPDALLDKLKKEINYETGAVRYIDRSEDGFIVNTYSGSSIKRAIRKVFKNNGINIVDIQFINNGNDHDYRIEISDKSVVSKIVKSNVKDIISDAVDTFGEWYRYDDVDEDGISKSFFKEYVNKCPYEIDEKDYTKILKGIYKKVK